MTMSIGDMAQAVALNNQLTILNGMQTVLTAQVKAGVTTTTIGFATATWVDPTNPDPATGTYTGTSTQITVPVATAQQVLTAEITAVQTALNALLAEA